MYIWLQRNCHLHDCTFEIFDKKDSFHYIKASFSDRLTVSLILACVQLNANHFNLGHELFSPGLEAFDLFFKGLKTLFKGFIPLKTVLV